MRPPELLAPGVKRRLGEVQRLKGTGERKRSLEEAAGRPRLGDRLPQGDQHKKLVSAPQRKAAVGHLVKTQKCSQRQACRFIGLSRSSARYQARDRVDEAELVERLAKFAGRRRRRGYRLAHRELRRGWL